MGGLMGAATSKGLVELMDAEGMAPDFLKEIDWPKLDMREVSQERYDQIAEPMGRFFMKHTKAELHEMAISKGIMLYPLNNVRGYYGGCPAKSQELPGKGGTSRSGRFYNLPRSLCQVLEKPPAAFAAPPVLASIMKRSLMSYPPGKKPSAKAKKALAGGEDREEGL